MSRNNILDSIRLNKSEITELPEFPNRINQFSWQELLADFKISLYNVGAEMICLNPSDDISTYLSIHFPDAVDFGKIGLWEEYGSTCPKEKLSQLKTILLEGRLGVAENGSIWIEEGDFPNRLIPFIAELVIVKLRSGKIVNSMTEAYEQITLDSTGFGVFISGPSKTADIEQCLVYGAHGPKNLIVIIY